jgi:hypothetical protein
MSGVTFSFGFSFVFYCLFLSLQILSLSSTTTSYHMYHELSFVWDVSLIPCICDDLSFSWQAQASPAA